MIQLLGLTPSKYGGFEKYLINLSIELQKKGYDVIFIDTAKTHNIPLHIIRELPGWKGKLLYCKDVAKFLFKESPSVVHCHFSSYSYLALLVAWTMRVKARFYTDHCMPIFANYWKQSVVIELMGKLTYRMLGVSESVTNVYRDAFKLKNAETLYLGVQPQLINPSYCRDSFREQLKIDKDTVVIANIAFVNQ